MNHKRPYPSLEHWRKAHGYGQRAAAQVLHISQAYYSRLERGKQAPRPSIARRISDETGVPLETLLGVA